MRYSLLDVLIASLKTAIILVGLEVVSSSVFPALGLTDFRPPFHILIILYLAFKVNYVGLPYIILFFQSIHSLFSIEGWAVGTIIALIVVSLVKYFKELLDFSTWVSTVVVVQVFQLIWFIFLASLLSIKLGEFTYFFTIIFNLVPESILLTILSPFFFMWLDRIWQRKGSEVVA